MRAWPRRAEASFDFPGAGVAPEEDSASDFDGGAANAAGLDLSALPPCDRDEEHRELRELPHPRPLGGVPAPRAGPGLPGAEVLPLGAETKEEEHDVSVGAASAAGPDPVIRWLAWDVEMLYRVGRARPGRCALTSAHRATTL